MLSKSLPVKAQAAAVRVLLDEEGKTLAWVKKKHPQLLKGVEMVERERAASTTGRGSGTVGPLAIPSLRK